MHSEFHEAACKEHWESQKQEQACYSWPEVRTPAEFLFLLWMYLWFILLWALTWLHASVFCQVSWTYLPLISSCPLQPTVCGRLPRTHQWGDSGKGHQCPPNFQRQWMCFTPHLTWPLCRVYEILLSCPLWHQDYPDFPSPLSTLSLSGPHTPLSSSALPGPFHPHLWLPCINSVHSSMPLCLRNENLSIGNAPGSLSGNSNSTHSKPNSSFPRPWPLWSQPSCAMPRSLPSFEPHHACCIPPHCRHANPFLIPRMCWTHYKPCIFAHLQSFLDTHLKQITSYTSSWILLNF